MREVFLDKQKDFVQVGIMIDDNLEHFYKLENSMLTGNIYLGKVVSIKKDIGVFVDIGLEKNAITKYRPNMKIGDYIVVMVTKEPRGDKGCAITEHITLAGRYCVLNDVGEYKFSKNLSESRKVEIFSLEPIGENVGYIFRSMADIVKLEDILSEMKELYVRYENILAKAKNNYKISPLYVEEPIEVAKRFAESDDSINYDFSLIEKEIKNIYARKVVRKSVELVFDKTEAMTVVDINLHKYNRNYNDIDKANFEANKIAIEELARQLRLRNIGGIIAVDFISMVTKSYVESLFSHLLECLKADNVKTSASLVEKAGIFIITRKQRYASL